MLDKVQGPFLAAQFAKNLVIWLHPISTELNTSLWMELVPFLPKHTKQEQREFLRRAMIHLVTDKIQNTEMQIQPHSLPHSLVSLSSLWEPGSSLKKSPLIKASIAHSKFYGIFVCSPKGGDDNQFVGVDLEISNRVTEEIIKRVATPVEVFDAPSAAHLWAAKEASFKSLTNNKTQLISDLLIHSWKPFLKETLSSIPKEQIFFHPNSSWQYQFENIQKNKKYTGKGWVINFADYTLAFCYLDKN